MARIEVINDRFTGCMLGAAVGDAFGYPLEGMEYEDMCDRFDHIGAIDLAVSKKSGTALFTDDTQMTLFTADGILWADMMGGKNGDIDYAEYVFYAYQFWLYTQTKTVAGKEYALVSSDSPEYMQRVAAYVDRKINETALASRLPSNMVAVLTCLNMADDLMKSHDENTRLRRELMLVRKELEDLKGGKAE